MPTPTPKLLLTVEEAADRLGIGRTLMYALIKDKHVKTVTIGRLRRIRPCVGAGPHRSSCMQGRGPDRRRVGPAADHN